MRFAAAGASWVALAGCTLLVDTSDLATGPSSSTRADAAVDGANDAGPIVDGTRADGATDAASSSNDAATRPDAGPPCTTALSLDDPRWTYRMNALRGDDQSLVLTTATTYQAGAAWWADARTFDRFDMSAQIRVTAAPPTTVSDGIAFSWIRGAAVPGIGDSGGAMGVSGLAGFGVIVDTFTLPGSTSETPAPFVAVVDTSKDDLVWVLKSNELHRVVADGVDHVLRVVLDGGAVTVYFDGDLQIDGFAIPGYAPFTGHFGFSAGTGQYLSDQRVTGVTLCP